MSVVCALDNSPSAPNVARYAADLAARIDNELWLVRALNLDDPLFVPTGTTGRGAEDFDRRRESVLQRTREHLEQTASQLEGVDAKAEVRQGDPDIEVLEAAADHRANFVVVGTRARTGLRGIGSVAQRIIRRARGPVVVIPPDYDEKLSERPVLVAGVRGGDPKDAEVIVREAGRVARAMGAELVLAHVEQGATEPPAWLREIAPADGRVVALSGGQPARDLLRLAKETGADGIVVAPRGHGPLRQALLGSVSSALLAAGERPIVVIPRTHRARAGSGG